MWSATSFEYNSGGDTPPGDHSKKNLSTIWFFIKRHMEQEQLIMPHYHMHMHGRQVGGAAAHECQSNQH